jgi:hypothetical protein
MVSEMNKLIIIVASMGCLAFILLGFSWGENLLNQEYITRFDYLVLMFSGMGTILCINVLFLIDNYKGEYQSLIQSDNSWSK